MNPSKIKTKIAKATKKVTNYIKERPLPIWDSSLNPKQLQELGLQDDWQHHCEFIADLSHIKV